MTDCVCAECGPCRRSLRESAYAPPRPVTLSPKALEILAEPAGTPYRPTRTEKREPKQPKRRGQPKVIRPRGVTIPIPTPCARCKQMRGLQVSGAQGRGRAIAGKGDLCEVCMHLDWCVWFLQQPVPSPQTPTIKQRLAKARHYQERILVDGRAFSTTAKAHGTANTYSTFGCRCPDCLAWKSGYNKVNPHIRKAA